MHNILLDDNIDFHYNPFAGINLEEVGSILVPKFDVEALVQKIETSESLIVEFVGKKGRGKTTHLVHLHHHLSQYPIYLLNRGANFKEILDDSSPVVFIDSMHHLNMVQRNAIFRKKNIVILTTHWTKALEYRLSGKPLLRIRFRGLTLPMLRSIVHKRLMLARTDHSQDILINDEALRFLLKKHKDDYRAIINELFDNFQHL